MRALSTRNDDPHHASRPWDKDRDGFVIGEGAGILILEELEHAKKRGAKILAEVAGYGMSADANHITQPAENGEGGFRVMRNAMRDAGIEPTQVGYVNAHGTSTPLGDELEAMAIKRAFGEHAYKMAVSSTKSMTGHLLGGAGGLEAGITVLALREQIVPPTMNLESPRRRLRSRLRAQHAAQGRDGVRHVELVRLRRHQRMSCIPAVDGVEFRQCFWCEKRPASADRFLLSRTSLFLRRLPQARSRFPPDR